MRIDATWTTNEVIHGVLRLHGIAVSFGRYALVGNSVRSCLDCLRDDGLFDVLIDDHEIHWA